MRATTDITASCFGFAAAAHSHLTAVRNAIMRRDMREREAKMLVSKRRETPSFSTKKRRQFQPFCKELLVLSILSWRETLNSTDVAIGDKSDFTVRWPAVVDQAKSEIARGSEAFECQKWHE